jgi:hypothetical protein
MAFAHIHFNSSTTYGAMLRRMLNQMEAGDDEMQDVRDMMIQMRDGADNAGDHSNYAEVTARFGFATNTKAREAFLEIDSAYSKTSGNGSVTDVRAARDQLFAKLRG